MAVPMRVARGAALGGHVGAAGLDRAAGLLVQERCGRNTAERGRVAESVSDLGGGYLGLVSVGGGGRGGLASG